MKHRLTALDWLRGTVIILMALDHASAAFNRGRLVTDSFLFYRTGMALPAAQFWTRWVTHICAPTFLFLAGTALALSVERRALRPPAHVNCLLLLVFIQAALMYGHDQED